MSDPAVSGTGRRRPRPWWWLAPAVATALALCAVLLQHDPREPARATPTVTPLPAATAGEICSTGQNRYPSQDVDSGRYVINPNEWNATGGLCISSTDGATGFRVTRSGISPASLTDPDRGPGAYPHISTQLQPGTGPLPIPVGNLRYATSSWHTTQVDDGVYNASYDIWYSGNRTSCSFTESAELMIWLHGNGKTPFGRPAGDLQVGGTSYRVYEAPKNGSHTLITYAMATSATSVTDLDLRAFTRDAVQRGYVPGGSYLCAVQAGFEIWDGGAGLSSDSFSFQAATGQPSGAITSALPGLCLDSRVAGDPAAIGAGTCDGSPAQTWTMGGDGSIGQSGRCVEDPAIGFPVLTGCTSHPDQRWRVTPAGQLVNQDTGRCVENPGGAAGGTAGTVAGGTVGASVGGTAQVSMRPCDGRRAQEWHPPT
ncbi:ricin-type beta-trefoil lectin domain protein [Kitasatospora sp. SUK 42]|uniref:GH12 family glycosyl hydrolase domain-containing protein n=1 Tax=Kitasatospora sp. SUK 42 TaxID=1588882 RepID=UPI0018C9F6A4|nr:ricin-type beta-trefoil lectin domain protein [Kitasatospora sp. SUK 42]MBV2152074.1 ricin-type beta-trefoil lectin domain protein [Kitasatospora sp. SUK 42]